MDKSQRAAVYRSFLMREPPKDVGSVDWPTPKSGALKGKKILVTGVLDTIERNDLIELLRGSSAHVMSTMSKNLDILVVGRDAGPSKLQKAEEWGVNQMSEKECYDFLKETLEAFDGQDEEGTVETKPASVKKKGTPSKRSSKRDNDAEKDGEQSATKKKSKK